MAITTFILIKNEVMIPLQVNVMENEFFTLHSSITEVIEVLRDQHINLIQTVSNTESVILAVIRGNDYEKNKVLSLINTNI